jgi:hypothetical protein
MALNAEDLARLEALLGSPQSGPGVLADFRTRFPGLTLTRCDVSDLGSETPFREYPRFNLYLVDGSDHCWQITAEPARATGVVVAKRRVTA